MEKVLVRIRPTNNNGIEGDRTIKKVSSDALCVGDRQFTFDSVFDSNSSQEDIFQSVGVPLVRNALAGFNTSIMSYGQDKWRNLLRASFAQNFNKKEAEQNDKLAPRPLSSNVARLVRELAKIHPYPRQRGSKKSCRSQVGSSVIASQSQGSPSTGLGRRNVRRKKCA